MDAAFALAKNIVSIKYEDIPAEVREVTKRSILDTLGVMIAGSTAALGCRGLVELVKEAGGNEESTIIAFGGKVPSWMAAFANGGMAHSLDYDDVLDETGTHPSITTVPAAFAIAERVGRVNGREFITAIALGNDLNCRMALAAARGGDVLKHGWLPAPVFGGFSATAASGKLLGLSESQMVDAFGIALTQAAGSMELVYGTESILRGLYAAFPNKVGVLSALMAQKGISGPKNSLEGKGGFFNVYYGGDYDASCLTANLGKRFEGAEVSFKPWPACRCTHPYIDAALSMVQEHDIHPQDIHQITVLVGDLAQTVCEPLEARQRPSTTMDAKYSIPFTVATAVARRKVVIGDFTVDGIKDVTSLEVAKKVTPKFDPQFNIPGRSITPGEVEIKLKDGTEYSKRVDFPSGDPRRPMSREDLIGKFRDCATYSVTPLSKKNVANVIQMVTELEKVEDVGQIIRLLS